jgi:hypothetical protein
MTSVIPTSLEDSKSPVARARHSDFKTMQKYIDLAGVVFGGEVALLGDWYAGASR